MSECRTITTESVPDSSSRTAARENMPSNADNSNQNERVKDAAKTDPQESILTRLYLTANFMTQVPFYSIALCLAGYGYMVVKTAPYRWLQAALLLYVPYCTLGLDKSPTTGIKWLSYETIEWFRYSRCFRDAARFLKTRLVKTHELDPQHAYILAYHPHGIIGMGGAASLSTNGCDFPSIFPGIRRWGVTLHQIFMVPFYREWLLANGFLVADKATMEAKLRAGDSLVLIPGGAAEALYAANKRMVLYLSNRKGFIKIAMDTGASLVPCIGFGENDVFHTYVPEDHHGPLAAALQKLLLAVRKYTRFSTPIMTWPIPKRTRVTVVVGKPMSFPADSDLDQNHEAYIQAVRALYDEHKAECGFASVALEII